MLYEAEGTKEVESSLKRFIHFHAIKGLSLPQIYSTEPCFYISLSDLIHSITIKAFLSGFE